MNLVTIRPEDEPKCLKELRESSYSYTQIAQACLKETRKVLLRTQHGLCAYCEQKFKSVVFVEHHKSQAEYPNKSADFDNLLGVCSGKEYLDPKMSRRHVSHCGDHKGTRTLSLDPRIAAHIDCIYYDSDAGIRSSDPVHDNELHSVLNLNASFLKSKRDDNFKKNLSNLLIILKKYEWTKQEALRKALSAITRSKIESCGYISYRYLELKKKLG